MRQAGLHGAKRRGKPWRTTRPDPQAHLRPDLVNRDFTTGAPNELLVADLSYLRCWGLLFFAFIIDAFSQMIVGWQLAQNMRTMLVFDALRMALGISRSRRRPRARAPLRPQYTSFDYTRTLSDHGMLASVGSVGDAYDCARSPNASLTASRPS